MAQPVIYLDKSMLLNFAMDFLILALTARLSGYKVRTGRLAAGSFLGSLYILVIFLPQIPFLYNMSVKFLVSCLIVVAAFYPVTLKKFLVATGYFYAVSFALGGAIYGFSSLSSGLQGKGEYEVLLNLIQGTGDFFDVLIWGFPLALLFWATLGRWAWKGLRKSLVQAVFRFPVFIRFGQVEVKLEGLVDTGNQLRDPLTKSPVVVVEAKLLVSYLPDGFEQAVAELDIQGIEDCLRGTHWGERIRVIPFSSVGRQNGLMIGFIPDMLTINTQGGIINTTKVIVGLYTRELSPDGAYRALLHPDLIPAAG